MQDLVNRPVPSSITWEGEAGIKTGKYAIHPTLIHCENLKPMVVFIPLCVNFMLYYSGAQVSGGQYKQQ
jgi:hypothetical protein